MTKVKIQVVKSFKLNVKGGAPIDFPIGVHTVDEAVANHWYVKAHLGEAVEGGDNEAAADELLAELEAKAKAIDEREKAADELKKRLQEGFESLHKMEDDLKARAQELHDREVAIDGREKLLEAKEKALSEASTKTTTTKK